MVPRITLVPTEDVAPLYSPREVFASAFWVRVKRGIYRNDIGYVLSRNGDTVDILVAPRERPYDNDRRQILFDVVSAQRAGYAVTVEEPADLRAGVVTCRGRVYHQGLLRLSLPKKTLEVVELPHPDDLAFHALANIDASLIRRTVATFSAHFWQKGDLVRLAAGELLNTTGRIVSVDVQNRSAVISIHSDKGPVEHSCLISHLQRVHKCGDWVKILAGSDKGIEGCVTNHVGESLVLAVRRLGETVEVRAQCF